LVDGSNGDANFKASTSAVLKQVVTATSNAVGAVTIAPSLVEQALSAPGDETLESGHDNR
jgi:hypothetical protein